MKKFKLSALFIIAALGIAAVGSAALSSLNFERNVSAGQILVDTDANVAIQISNTSNYVGLVKTDADGKVTLNLNEAINNNANGGFNTDAVFAIGSATSGAIKIKNNSDIPITVSMTNDASTNNAITLSPVNSSSSTIAVGSSGNYYFTINTNGQDALKTLNAVLHVEGK
ncbi:MAG: hypothetical protein K0S76_1635 [Herbinix sp.]|jgi:uncharacterized protein involved in tellurium resistance|nr:hypothetical protein [Herbinix sp.]